MLRLLDAFVDALYFYSHRPATLLTTNHEGQVFDLIRLGSPHNEPLILILLVIVGLRLDPVRASCTQGRINWLEREWSGSATSHRRLVNLCMMLTNGRVGPHGYSSPRYILEILTVVNPTLRPECRADLAYLRELVRFDKELEADLHLDLNLLFLELDLVVLQGRPWWLVDARPYAALMLGRSIPLRSIQAYYVELLRLRAALSVGPLDIQRGHAQLAAALRRPMDNPNSLRVFALWKLDYLLHHPGTPPASVTANITMMLQQ
jgi:hypothetical protein